MPMTPLFPKTALAVRLLRRLAGSRRVLPVLGVVAAADYALWFLPSKTLVIVTAMLHPGAWWRIAAWFAAGSTVGATALAAIVAWVGPPAVHYLFGDISQSVGWQRAHAMVNDWGAWALWAFAALPWPLRTVVAVCVVLDLSVATVAVSVATGRLAGFLVLTRLCARMPGWFARSPRIRAAWIAAAGPEGPASP